MGCVSALATSSPSPDAHLLLLSDPPHTHTHTPLAPQSPLNKTKNIKVQQAQAASYNAASTTCTPPPLPPFALPQVDVLETIQSLQAEVLLARDCCAACAAATTPSAKPTATVTTATAEATATTTTTTTAAVTQRVLRGDISVSSSSGLCASLEGITELQGNLTIQGMCVL